MQPAHRILALLWIASSPLPAQTLVAIWFPTNIGDTWTFEHETRDDTGRGAGNLESHLWRSEETITGAWTLPEGPLLGARQRITQGSSSRPVDPNPAFLLRGPCLYFLSGADWNPSSHQLSAAWQKALNAGDISPNFCFPLTTRQTWGSPHSKDWQVTGKELLVSTSQDTFHIHSISSVPGSGTTADIWFQKGVGIVREDLVHHGAIGQGMAGEEHIRLLNFQPARR